MSTKYWSSLKQNSLGTSVSAVDDAAFRAWATDLHNSFIEIGLSAETVSAAAQADLSVAVIPAPYSASVFKIYELNDSFSAELPIYIKVAYGGIWIHNSYKTVAVYPQCFVQFGTTVNALGELGGLVTDTFSVALHTSGSLTVSGETGNNLLSKSDGVLIAFASGANSNYLRARGVVSFALERVPDEFGNMTANGYTVVKPTPTSPSSSNAADAETRTLTTTNDSGVWNINPCVCSGGASAASVNGAIQFQRFYHSMQDLRPMISLLAYYDSSLMKGSILAVPIGSGRSRVFRALGRASSTTEYFYNADRDDTNFSVACLWE